MRAIEGPHLSAPLQKIGEDELLNELFSFRER